MVDPARVLTKGAARPGDRLFLTKRIGTGVVTTAIKRDAASPDVAGIAIASMSEINHRAGAVLLTLPEIRACTDVSGYALAGHCSEMAAASGVQMVIDWGRVPVLPGAIELARAGNVPGGTRRNRAYLLGDDAPVGEAPRVTVSNALDDVAQALAFDPQTSGGLLFAVAPGAVERVRDAFNQADVSAYEIGEVREGFGLHLA
jgi:selenide,water dikinase